MTVPLRPATLEDAPACAAILREWIAETDWFPTRQPPSADTPFLAQKINAEEVTIAGDLDGFLARDGAYISCLYIRRAARGRGLGHALLAHAKSRAPKLSLWTFQRNTGAQRFYLREGFREAQRTDGAENEEKLPDIEYTWTREGHP